ncbi:TonB-dependent receptor [Dysgonomonas sp. Marseille-P4361]|uniref:SusC/RagA family TonB-linked outer membrane protein n=1 Tax=Dysgonomonas sp. Marseille-P4361 TaxID=2161820 RepID=UPI000D5564FE|nr:TonB-dependent receptor [Dysgonomonas sp. Marseille-P4361]
MLKKILSLLLIFCSITVYGQNVKLTGNVADDKNEILTGATVAIKGTTRATMTDLDGNYQIEVSRGETISFSLIGMKTQELVYQGEPVINIRLETDDKLLEEVVVIGYQTIKKADLTGAVSTFNPEDMKNTIVSGGVGDALGTLPGLMVRTAGNPGSEGKVVIRGMGTFGNSDPLYVVDGVVSGANRDFNYNDIESIQVLKDASAAAIYGSRAGNGVIIITTKQGKQGEMKIDVSSRVSVQWLPKYNLTGRDRWIELNDMAFINGGKAPAYHFDANTDWQKEVYKNGILHDHNLSLSGGGEKNNYFFSANYQSNSGTTIGTDSKRYTLRSNTSAFRDFGEHVRFRVGENITMSNYAVNELNTNPVVDVYRMLPTIPIYDEEHAETGGYGYGEGSRDVTFGVNPFAREDFEDTRNSNLRIRGNAFTELEAMKMFKYRFNFGFDYSNDKHKYLRKVGSWAYNEPPVTSSLNKNQAQYAAFSFDNTLEFNKQFGKHSTNVIVGSSYQTTNYEQIWGTKSDVLTSGNDYFDELNAALNIAGVGSYRNESKLFSLFGRVNYNYAEKYLFSFTMRRDEASKFPKSDRVGYFPSISAGWRISGEEGFDVSWIDDLKLRVNYGVLGTSNNDYYDYIAVINNKPQAMFGDNLEAGMTQSALTNTSLKWEEMSQLNAGFDATILNNRLTLAADYFIKESKDVLTRMPLSLYLGHWGNDPWVNAATLKNTGFEVSATWRDKINVDMDYSVGVNFSYLKNKLTSMGYTSFAEGETPHFSQWNTKSFERGSIGQWYLIKTDGIFRTQAELDAYKTSSGDPIKIQGNDLPQLGDVRYIDANDDGQITDADRQYCGENMPKYELGMNLGFRYKDFDLQMVLGGAFGHKIFNGPRSAIDMFSDNSNYRDNYDPWSLENPNAKDPRPIYGDSRNVRGNQDRWLENGSYLKFKQIALGYNIPKSVLGQYISNLRLYVNAQNLLTITSYTGLDPEFLNGSMWERSYDGGAFPNPRAVTFGAQITF